jgi:hypothetical protein
MRKLLILAGFALVAGCSESTAPDPPAEPPPVAPPVVGPTNVVILAAFAEYTTGFVGTDVVSIRLSNKGGTGAFYLEFWALPSGPNTTVRRMVESEVVTVLAGYDESLAYSVTGLGRIQSVKVKSRPVNTAVWTQTDCRVLRELSSYCP